jgi:hypothetical protein
MTRDPAWPNLLVDFIEERRDRPFSWGSNDCCLFASDWIRLCTGIDPAADLRGRYHSALSAARVMRSHGGVAGIVESIGGRLGLEPVTHARAQRGDLVMQDNGLGNCLGIVLGPIAAFVADRGLLFSPFVASPCWRV